MVSERKDLLIKSDVSPTGTLGENVTSLWIESRCKCEGKDFLFSFPSVRHQGNF